MSTRKFSSIAQATSLAVGVNSAATTITVEGLVGWPNQTPFTAALNPGTQNEEIVTVTGVSGTNLTVVRGEDGTIPVEHAAGAEVRHKMTAHDLREVHEHAAASSGVHGVTGEIVGTTDEQELEGKTLDGTKNTFVNVPQEAITGLIAALQNLADDIASAEDDAAADLASAVAALTSAIDGKANASHRHNITDIDGAIDATTLNGRRFFVQASAPASPSAGDVWLVI